MYIGLDGPTDRSRSVSGESYDDACLGDVPDQSVAPRRLQRRRVFRRHRVPVVVAKAFPTVVRPYDQSRTSPVAGRVRRPGPRRVQHVDADRLGRRQSAEVGEHLARQAGEAELARHVPHNVQEEIVAIR